MYLSNELKGMIREYSLTPNLHDLLEYNYSMQLNFVRMSSEGINSQAVKPNNRVYLPLFGTCRITYLIFLTSMVAITRV